MADIFDDEDDIQDMRDDAFLRSLDEDSWDDGLEMKQWREDTKERIDKKFNGISTKTGYVQGVCESVLAITNMEESSTFIMGKKLLAEMNVTKETAKKYANPETYKKLEQGIFAEREQTLKQSQGVKR